MLTDEKIFYFGVLIVSVMTLILLLNLIYHRMKHNKLERVMDLEYGAIDKPKKSKSQEKKNG